MHGRSPMRWLAIVLAVAFALRAVWAVGLHVWLDRQGRMFLIAGDAEGYWHLAGDIAARREFAVYEPPRRVLRMPGFPALLAVPMLLFDNPLLPARMLLAAVGTAACGLVYLLGRTLFDEGIGLVAAGLTAVSPTLIGFTPLILSETLFATCLLASLVAMARLVRGDCRGAGWGLVTGGLIGLTCFVRPSWLLSAPAFAGTYFVLAKEKGKALLVAAAVLFGAVAVLIPWGVRNERATGHFVLTTLWMGPSLYDGLGPQATGDSNMTFFDVDNVMGRGMSEFDMNRHYADRAKAFVRDHPLRTIELAAIKCWRYFKPWPNAEQFGGPLPAVLMAAFVIPMFLFALCGWWTVRGDVWGWGLTVGPLFYFAALHMVFVSSIRYRLPAEYPLLVMTAVGWRSLMSPDRLPEQEAHS
ncbi:MAG: glycosyltransferase family 39 protein [Planctomycetaceae bacterium]|nr:glycosyltransferase family 39 protein [Planctomycetaceae bacterium]